MEVAKAPSLIVRIVVRPGCSPAVVIQRAHDEMRVAQEHQNVLDWGEYEELHETIREHSRLIEKIRGGDRGGGSRSVGEWRCLVQPV